VETKGKQESKKSVRLNRKQGRNGKKNPIQFGEDHAIRASELYRIRGARQILERSEKRHRETLSEGETSR